MLSGVLDCSWMGAYENWFWFAMWLAGGVLGVMAVGFVWRCVLTPLTKKTRTRLDEMVLTPIRRPLQCMVFLAAVYVGSTAQLMPMAGAGGKVGWEVFEGVLYVLLVLAAAFGVHGMLRGAIDGYFPRGEGGPGEEARGYLGSILRMAAKVLLFFMVLMILFEHFKVPVASLLATAGIASLAVALAAQETLANLIAGVALLVDRPFKAGDRIQLTSGQTGDVIEIGLRSTRVLSYDDSSVITIPNSEVAKAQIINLNAPTANVKIRCMIGVAYGTDVRKAKVILQEIMSAHPSVGRQPPPVVYFTEFAEAAMHLQMEYRVIDYREKSRVQDELNVAILDRFAAEGIAFPQRDLNVRLYRMEKGQG
jgi:small-conductance mechanosensitive channel